VGSIDGMPGMDLSSLTLDRALGQAQQSKLRELGRGGESIETPAGLEKTAREFEAVFMNTLMRAMRKTIPDNKLFNSSGPTKYYEQMRDTEMARAMATGRSGMGIADLIIHQFSARVQDASQAKDAASEMALPSVDQSGKSHPVRRETFGPPAPVRRYAGMSPVGRQVARMARLRGLATAQGGGVADTLRRFDGELQSAGHTSGLDPALLLAVTMEESGGDPDARSAKGAVGLMQLMPATAVELGVSDRNNPGQNLQGGASYRAQMLRRYEGRLDVALAAYNAGPGNVDQAGGEIPSFNETRDYVRRVLVRYEELGGGTILANQPDR